MFGECCSSQDWATAIGVPPSRLATDSTTSDVELEPAEVVAHLLAQRLR